MNVQRDVVLAPLTTIRLGGEAAHFVECGDVDDIREALAYAEGHNLAIHILGGGSNTIFHDQGFAGLVLAIRLSGVSFREEGEHVLVDVAAGEDWDDLVRACIERGLGGIECMSGVPGLVGATPIQNVGAYGQEVADTITQVTVFNRQTKETEILSVEECQLGYRTSRFKESDAGTYIVLEVQFRLLKDASPCVDYEQVQQAAQRKFGTVDFGKGKKALQIVRELVLDLRRMKSMVVSAKDPHSRSCGSFFVAPLVSKGEIAGLSEVAGEEPPYFLSTGEGAGATPLSDAVKIPAGWLVEQAGFHKGYREQGVGISPNHALALVNYEGTTEELLQLARNIQERVYRRFRIQLEQEPVAVPYKLP